MPPYQPDRRVAIQCWIEIVEQVGRLLKALHRRDLRCRRGRRRIDVGVVGGPLSFSSGLM
jgi:hypothetical protein